MRGDENRANRRRSAQTRESFHAACSVANRPVPPISSRNPSLPRHLDAVFARALAKDPNARFATCGEFVEALRAFERDYRARLRGFVEGQLKALEDAAPAGPVAPPPPPGLSSGSAGSRVGEDDMPALPAVAGRSGSGPYQSLRDVPPDQLGINASAPSHVCLPLD